MAGVALLFTAAVGTTPAAAQHACQGDAFRLCNQFIPDRGKVASCLFKNKRSLTPGLSRSSLAAARPACRARCKGKRYGKRKRRR